MTLAAIALTVAIGCAVLLGGLAVLLLDALLTKRYERYFRDEQR